MSFFSGLASEFLFRTGSRMSLPIWLPRFSHDRASEILFRFGFRNSLPIRLPNFSSNWALRFLFLLGSRVSFPPLPLNLPFEQPSEFLSRFRFPIPYPIGLPVGWSVQAPGVRLRWKVNRIRKSLFFSVHSYSIPLSNGSVNFIN